MLLSAALLSLSLSLALRTPPFRDHASAPLGTAHALSDGVGKLPAMGYNSASLPVALPPVPSAHPASAWNAYHVRIPPLVPTSPPR